MIQYTLHLPATYNKAEKLWEVDRTVYPKRERETLLFADKKQLEKFVDDCRRDAQWGVYQFQKLEPTIRSIKMETVKLAKDWEVKPGVTVLAGSSVRITLQRKDDLAKAGLLAAEAAKPKAYKTTTGTATVTAEPSTDETNTNS
jgi:hypothetical protein